MEQIKKLLPLFIIILISIACSAEVQERERVVEILNKKFDLPAADRCAVKFSMEKFNQNGVVLIAEACSLLEKQTLRSNDILTPDNLTLIRNAKFEKMEIYQYGGGLEIVPIQQNLP